MRKIILLIFITIISCTNRSDSPFIVTNVERRDNGSGFIYSGKIYSITLNGETTLYTNHLYQVGDTIK